MTNQTVGNKGICSNGESPVAAARALFFHVGSSPPPPPSPLSLSPRERRREKLSGLLLPRSLPFLPQSESKRRREQCCISKATNKGKERC